MDPRRVLTFRAVAHERSFSAAARALALTQPAVSQQVAALEREVGARLLDREPGGLRLTPAGRDPARARRRARRPPAARRDAAGGARGHRAPRLRIGAFPSALAALVPEAVQRLRRAVPEVEVQVAGGRQPELAERVRARRVAPQRRASRTRRCRAASTTGSSATTCCASRSWSALSPDHPLAGRATRADRRAGRGRVVGGVDGDGLIARACRAAGFEPRIVAITRDPLAIREFIAAGIAVTLVPRLLAPGLRRRRVRARSSDGPQRDVYVAAPARRPPPAGRTDAGTRSRK